MDTECKIFTGAILNGYGVAYRNGKTRRAHRLAYCDHHGIPIESIDGLVIRHKCDIPACIEPTHLEPGTHADNVLDKIIRGRQPRGETNPAAKLTEADVMEIRRRYVPRCPINCSTALAKEFGCSQATVSRIVKGKLWAHVKETNSGSIGPALADVHA